MDDLGPDLGRRVAAVRRFNRFYTRRIGVLGEGHLRSAFSLAEARLLYELAHRDGVTASVLGAVLGLDAGYLSRLLRGFRRQGLVDRQPSETDGRQRVLRLTAQGGAAAAALGARADAEVASMLGALAPAAQERLVQAMQAVEGLLAHGGTGQVPYVLRLHRPGDMGWVVHRHGVLYAREYGWDERFEGLVAEVVAAFVRQFDPARERCWMAERDGQVVGSVFVVRASDEVAQLRLLLVEPEARGLGLGARLVDECIAFAREAAYRRLTLWTNDVLVGARRLYERAGFRLVRSEPHDRFGRGLVGETWDKEL